jgi:hypothetical protein
MKINQITETTAGSTGSGSVASVAKPLGKTQKRAGNLFKGKKTSKPFYEEAVKEDEIVEADLILVPGQIRKKDRGFIPHDKDRRDHEVEMARSDLYAAAKDAMRIYKLLQNRSEMDGIMGWQQSYITLAADYLNSVADSIEHEIKMNEMTGGVLAGGMSNFEESEYKSGSDSTFVPSKTLKALDDWLLLSTQRDTAIYFGQTKKAIKIMHQIDVLEDQIMMMKGGAEELKNMKREFQMKYARKVAEGKKK